MWSHEYEFVNLKYCDYKFSETYLLLVSTLNGVKWYTAKNICLKVTLNGVKWHTTKNIKISIFSTQNGSIFTNTPLYQK